MHTCEEMPDLEDNEFRYLPNSLAIEANSRILAECKSLGRTGRGGSLQGSPKEGNSPGSMSAPPQSSQCYLDVESLGQ